MFQSTLNGNGYIQHNERTHMAKIIELTLNTKQGKLTVGYDSHESISLSYEYLRVFSPVEISAMQSQKPAANTPQVFHKKNVKIAAIEPLGKHGHRLLFDDGFVDIYADDDFITLHQQYPQQWPIYEASLTSINSREQSINFKAVT